MSVKDKIKSFLKIFFGIIAFLCCFFVVLGAVLVETHPRNLLTNFEEETIVHGYLDNYDGFYLGDLSDDKITGEGQYVLITGSSYYGEWNSNEIPEGQGTLVLNNIGKYEGSFEGGLRHGTGTFTWTNGDTYTGDWFEDVITGVGTITFSNGSSLHGTFESNTFTGGTFTTNLDIGTISISIDSRGVQDATLILSDGTKYDGTLTNGKFNGYCTIKYANGDRYDGTVKDNLKSGQGIYEWENDASYSGAWSGDKMNGYGTYYYGSITDGNKLQGDFKDNYPTGSMTYYDEDGDEYTTTWSDGKCTKIERN